MTTNKIYWEEIGVQAEVASFAPNSKIAEYHIMLHVEPRAELFEGQLSRIYKAEEHLFTELPGAKSVFKRYFLSDSTNQCPLMKAELDCATSIIQQPPLDGSKIAAWIYMQKGTEISTISDKTFVHHNGYCHIWQMGMCDNKGDSAQQTESLLTRYEQSLDSHNATLADNCIRTWFFVRDVDTQYAGMVKARKENFIKEGLTEKTHYISSTGIGGLPADTKALVQMDAYSITGFEPSQQRYLYAPTHLNPTYEYGVTFERGTLMEYGDRKHVFISGTASINNKGEVVNIGNIVKQTERMLENVEKLLEEAGTTFSDVMQIIVYLRDHADYDTVKQMFDSRFPDLPTVITLAPVCRPTWLIEMECIAVSSNDNNNYRDY
jgi:enamine deaminase RidA (YjgF/YER057c/UK114 family)